MKKTINSEFAPAAIGTYAQAVQVGTTVYVSGQIGLDPQTMQLVAGGFKPQLRQALRNVAALCQASGGDLTSVVKFTIYLIDMNDFPVLNEVFASYLAPPLPARAAVAVSALPQGACVEIEAVLEVPTSS